MSLIRSRLFLGFGRCLSHFGFLFLNVWPESNLNFERRQRTVCWLEPSTDGVRGLWGWAMLRLRSELILNFIQVLEAGSGPPEQQVNHSPPHPTPSTAGPTVGGLLWEWAQLRVHRAAALGLWGSDEMRQEVAPGFSQKPLFGSSVLSDSMKPWSLI